MKQLHDFAIRRPRLVLGLALAVTLAVAPGMLRLHLRTDGHALVPPRDPAVLLDNQVRQAFGVHDPLVIVVRSRNPDGIYDARTLALIARLTHAFQELPGIDSASVRSLATEPSERFRPGTLLRRELLDPLPATAADMDRLRGEIADIGLLSGTLLSRDERAAAILAGIGKNADRAANLARIRKAIAAGHDASAILAEIGKATDRAAIVASVREVIAAADTAGHDVTVIGAPVAEALLGVHILEDLGVSDHRAHPDAFDAPSGGDPGATARLRDAIARHVGLLPIALAFMGLVFLISFRSFAATWLPLSEALACLVFVFGLMGWLGVPVYLTMAVLPVILVSMGLADEIHVFTSYRQRVAAHPNEPITSAVRAALDETSLPVMATGWTTAIGFLAFALSPLAPIRAFGIFTAVGIVFCMVWTLTVIPALLVLLPPRALAGRKHDARDAAPRAWIPWIAKLGAKPAITLTLTAIALLASPLAIRKVEIQDSWISGFAPTSAFYRATQYFNQQFFGTHRLLLSVDTGRALLIQGRLMPSDLKDNVTLFPDSLITDPVLLTGCSLWVSVRPQSPATLSTSRGEVSPQFARPSYWSSVVESAERRDGRIAVTTPLYHGSAQFLLRPAPTDTLMFALISYRLAIPSLLMELDSLEQFVRARSHLAVGGVLGPSDQLATVEFLMSDRSPGSRGIPSDPDRVRWLWSALRTVFGTRRVGEIVTPELDHALITVFLKNANYRDTRQLMAEIRDYEREHLAPLKMRVDFAGDVTVSQALIEAIVHSQVGSLLASLLGIVAVSAILFRSLRWGVLCMAPAGIAVAGTFAMMGVVGMPLGVATSMFASMVLGVGVDFAIHLVHRYREATRRGERHEAAVLDALTTTGPGIMVNALAVTAGFGILTLSQVPANAQLGAITVVSLLGCLVATLLVLPPLLRVAAPRARTTSTGN